MLEIQSKLKKMASYAGVRGVRNVSGVSCHISAPLQVIYHGLPELRQALIRLADASGGCGRDEDGGCDAPSKAVQFVRQLGLLFKTLSLPPTEENLSADNIVAPPAVDPMPLYDVLPSSLKYKEVGDAATALRAILTTIRSGLEEVCNNTRIIIDEVIVDDAKSALDTCLCGSNVQRLEGTMRRTDVDASGNKKVKLVKRRKPDKERKLTVPFPIPVSGYSCLGDSLASVTTEAQVINGYDWEAVEDYDEQSETLLDANIDKDEEESVSSDSSSDSSDSSSSDSSSDVSSSSESHSLSSSEDEDGDEEEVGVWKTRKYALLNKVPLYFFIHLKRFGCKGGRVQKLSSVLDVPKRLNIALYSTDPCGADSEYELCGAIVHIDEESMEGANEIDEDAGHYISFVHLGLERKRTVEPNAIGTQMAACEISNTTPWIELNDEEIKPYDGETGESHVLNVLSGRYSKKSKTGGSIRGSKYATVLLYRRVNI